MELTFPVILDGATGTELQKKGYTGEGTAEEWILDHPDAILSIQKAYMAAGSNIVYAPTFGANSVKLEAHRIFDKVAEYNRKLTALSKQAVEDAERKTWVAGDIAPTGQFLYPLGEMRFEELVEIYTEQAAALEEAGADLFVIETMQNVSDARAAVLAIRSVSKKPIFVTFTCDENGKTMNGSDVCAVLQILQGMGVDAFGLNCSTGPDKMLSQFARLRKIARVPLIAKPNAGLPENVNGKTVYNCAPEEFASYVPALAAEGVAIFGGCCGTTPEHIAALRDALAHATMLSPSPEEACSRLLPCSTEKESFLLDPAASYDHVLECNADLEDALTEEEDHASPITAIRVSSAEALSFFEDAQLEIRKPLLILTEDAEILEKALRLYQGRAMYEGAIKEDILDGFEEKYGLIH